MHNLKIDNEKIVVHILICLLTYAAIYGKLKSLSNILVYFYNKRVEHVLLKGEERK